MRNPTSLQVLGERVQAARKAKGLSQEDLALESDTAPSYIGGVERGQRNPSFKKLWDTAAGRQEFERRREARRLEESDEEALQQFRRGWCLGSQEFRERRLEWVAVNLG